MGPCVLNKMRKMDRSYQSVVICKDVPPPLDQVCFFFFKWVLTPCSVGIAHNGLEPTTTLLQPPRAGISDIPHLLHCSWISNPFYFTKTLNISVQNLFIFPAQLWDFTARTAPTGPTGHYTLNLQQGFVFVYSTAQFSSMNAVDSYVAQRSS